MVAKKPCLGAVSPLMTVITNTPAFGRTRCKNCNVSIVSPPQSIARDSTSQIGTPGLAAPGVVMLVGLFHCFNQFRETLLTGHCNDCQRGPLITGQNT
ncbi:MAG: hypothetical protein JW395_0565 [Nitrospira sp.]|nr:hypothetical protein [Nitrospira sp.]